MHSLRHAYPKATPDPPRRAVVAQPFEVQVSNFGLRSERKLMSYKMASMKGYKGRTNSNCDDTYQRAMTAMQAPEYARSFLDAGRDGTPLLQQPMKR